MPNQSQTVEQRERRVVAVLSAAAFMATLDLFVVNVAYDRIGRDVGASATDLSWVLNAYAIVYAALLVPLGRLADRFGRKRSLLVSLAVFVVASVGCAASTDLWPLVAWRVLQAAGAAGLTPASLGLLLGAVAPARRARAVRVWATTGALAAAAGPVVGGVLVEAAWQWVFLVNVPIGIAAGVVAALVVPDSRDPDHGPLPDLLGALALAVAVGAVALAVVQGPERGWAGPLTLSAWAVAAVAVGVVVLRSRRHAVPVVEPDLLRNRTFAWGTVTALTFSVAFGAYLLSLVLWLQQVLDWGSLRTGLGVAPGPLLVPVFAVVAGRLLRTRSAATVVALGCTLFAASLVSFAVLAHPDAPYMTAILPGHLLGGAGVGLALPTMLGAASSSLAPRRFATGSAVVTMARQIGLVLGVSGVVAILAGRPGGEDAFDAVWLTFGAVSLVAALAATRMSTAAPAAPVHLPAPVAAQEIS